MEINFYGIERLNLMKLYIMIFTFYNTKVIANTFN